MMGGPITCGSLSAPSSGSDLTRGEFTKHKARRRLLIGNQSGHVLGDAVFLLTTPYRRNIRLGDLPVQPACARARTIEELPCSRVPRGLFVFSRPFPVLSRRRCSSGAIRLCPVVSPPSCPC